MHDKTETLKPPETGGGSLFEAGEIPEEYNDWAAEDPGAFIDLFNNIWNFFMFKADTARDMHWPASISTSFRHGKYKKDKWSAAAPYIYPDSERNREYIDAPHLKSSAMDSPHTETMDQR